MEEMSENDFWRDVVLMTYTGEPCRICGVNITSDDLKTLVFAGYSKNSKARAAHKECWEKHLPMEEWKYQ